MLLAADCSQRTHKGLSESGLRRQRSGFTDDMYIWRTIAFAPIVRGGFYAGAGLEP